MSRIHWIALFVLVDVVLAIVGLLLLGSSILFTIWPGAVHAPVINAIVPVDSGKYVIGQNFSAEEADRIIEIASTDPFATDAIYEIHPYAPLSRSDVICVTADKFLVYTPDHVPDDSPWLPRYRVLPVVVFTEGDPACEGLDMWVYVDPDRGYVPYIGHVVRQGREENWTYSTTDRGVEGTNKLPGVGAVSWFRDDNMSIGYTGFIYPWRMTEQQKADVLGIALNDSRVKGYLSGYDYRASEIHSASVVGLRGGDGYYLAYPSIGFEVMFEGQWVPLMGVDVDPLNDRITYIRPYSSPPSKNVSYYEIV